MDADLDRFATVPGALASFAVEIDEVAEALEPPIVTPTGDRTSVGAGEGSRRAADADPDQEAGRRGVDALTFERRTEGLFPDR